MSAYEHELESLHYTTRFVDGLKPAIRAVVAVQMPPDLDTAYTLALLQEEVAGELVPVKPGPAPWVPPVTRRPQPLPLPPPHAPVRGPEDKRGAPPPKIMPAEDKWAALRAYRRARGLCYTCGERYSRDHQCKGTVWLHVLQEVLDLFSDDAAVVSDSSTTDPLEPADLMLLAVDATVSAPSTLKFQLAGMVQNQHVTFLVDSGSTFSFLHQRYASQLDSVVPLSSTSRVKVADGAVLLCSAGLSQCEWDCDGHLFWSDFKLLALEGFDGILGIDWLARHSPMHVDWNQHRMSFLHQGQMITLVGQYPDQFACTVVELISVTALDTPAIPSEVQPLLDAFPTMFADPVGLPPRRLCDHSIPLILGAQPVNRRPYRYAPQLKTEIERQVAEMFDSGVVQPSNSAFSSPIILVKKKDETWRMVVDYRHFNALTIKSKYPVPVIDELLDELAGATWFSKLDLRAGYHLIRLTPGEEYKTAFQTHHGHFEFKVMAFGLTGAPATFLSAMNATLAPFLRKFVLVFFDDILIYSHSLDEHLQHIELVLQQLRDHRWQVKLSKCAFAQQSIAYLGHIISAAGVATDASKIATVRDWPAPTCVKALRSFLGLSAIIANLCATMESSAGL